MHLFSQRHKDEMERGEIVLSMPAPVRLKLIDCMKRYNIWDGVAMEDSLFFGKLKEIMLSSQDDYLKKLYVQDTMRKAVDMDQFMLDVKAELVFDSMEIYSGMIDPFRRDLFQEECNHIFKAENQPFKFEGGYVSIANDPAGQDGVEYDFMKGETVKRVFRFFSE